MWPTTSRSSIAAVLRGDDCPERRRHGEIEPRIDGDGAERIIEGRRDDLRRVQRTRGGARQYQAGARLLQLEPLADAQRVALAARRERPSDIGKGLLGRHRLRMPQQ